MFSRRSSWVAAAAWGALAIATPVAAQPAASFLTEEPPRRLALVVGNGAYVNAAPLPGSTVDADMMETMLKGMDFEVTKATDLFSREDFTENYLRPFAAKIKEGDIVVFYYSGHGFTFGGENYIMPLEFQLTVDSNHILDQFVSTAGVERVITGRRAGLVLIILDACRSIPNFRITTGGNDDEWVAKGLASPRSDVSSTIYWFSSTIGAVSLGSTEKKASVYTEALAEHLPVAARELTQVSREVRVAVMFRTGNRQVPWRSDSSAAELYFKPSPEVLANQKTLWEAVLADGTKFAVTHFLQINGTGPYGAAARRWLAANPNAPDVRPSAVSPIAAEVAWSVNTGGRDIVLPQVGGALAAQSVAISAPPLSMATATIAAAAPTLAEAFPTGGGGPSSAANADAFAQYQTSARNLDEASAIAVARSARRRGFQAGPSARSLNRLGRAVAAERVEARAKPSADTPVTRVLPPGAAVTIDGVTVDANQVNWLRARTGADDTIFYIEQKATDLEPIAVGRPVLEVTLSPRPDGLQSLVDPAPLIQALQDLKAAGTRVTWVSIATPKADQSAQAARLALQGVYVTSVLAAQGVSRNAVTTSEGASVDDGVRVRIFGKAG